MHAADLKRFIIKRVSQIEDPAYLKAIKTILDSKIDSEVIQLSKDQLDDLSQSDKDLKNGEYLDHNLLIREARKWLSVR